MGLFNRFPYTNFHELNLDWIIEKVKEMNAQAVKVSSEANNKSTESLTKSLQALTTSENALNTANTADRSSSQALSQSKSALDTANNADQKATQAVDTANGIDEKATRALNNSTSAVNTANTANRSSSQALSQSKSAVNTANGADTKATQAIDTANGIDEKATRALNNSTLALHKIYGGTFARDLNGLKEPGTYYCNFQDVTDSPYTSENYGLLEVLTPYENGSTCVQRITILNSDTSGNLTVDMSYRYYLNNQWYPWRRLLVDSAPFI